MFIKIEETPNPLTLKFNPGKIIFQDGPLNITSVQNARQCKFAELIFQIKGVTGILLGKDFISVTKGENDDWDILKPQILDIITTYLLGNKEIIAEKISTTTKENEENFDSVVVNEIKEIIEQKIRPAVAQDGGDIIFNRFTDGIVFLELHGACSGCPSSTITLKNGIENMLKHYIPEVKEVQAI